MFSWYLFKKLKEYILTLVNIICESNKLNFLNYIKYDFKIFHKIVLKLFIYFTRLYLGKSFSTHINKGKLPELDCYV